MKTLSIFIDLLIKLFILLVLVGGVLLIWIGFLEPIRQDVKARIEAAGEEVSQSEERGTAYTP